MTAIATITILNLCYSIVSEETERSCVENNARHEEAEQARRGERSEPQRRAQPSPDRRLEKIIKKVNYDIRCYIVCYC